MFRTGVDAAVLTKQRDKPSADTILRLRIGWWHGSN